MADEQTNESTPAEATANAKVKTVLDDMPQRAILPNTEAAAAYILEANGKYADFGNHELISPIDTSRDAVGLGLDEEGNLVFDSEIFPEGMAVMVSVLSQRGEGANSSTVKCIVVSPVPTVETILADEQGRKFIDKIVATELNRIAVRGLRPKDANIKDPVILDAMPRTLADYTTSNRGGASTLTEAFENLWKPIKAALGKLSKPWRLANLSKREFKNAMSSKAYAAQYYPTLEETPAGSLFVLALQAFEQEGTKAGHDVSLFRQWRENRDSYEIEEGEDEGDDETELSFDALSAALAQPESKPEEAPAATEEAAPESTGEPAAEEAPAAQPTA